MNPAEMGAALLDHEATKMRKVVIKTQIDVVGITVLLQPGWPQVPERGAIICHPVSKDEAEKNPAEYEKWKYNNGQVKRDI